MLRPRLSSLDSLSCCAAFQHSALSTVVYLDPLAYLTMYTLNKIIWQETYHEMEFEENWEFTLWCHESCFIINDSNFQAVNICCLHTTKCKRQRKTVANEPGI